MNFRHTLSINDKNHLEIGGADTVELVKRFGTPLYVMDKNYIESVAKSYISAIMSDYPAGGAVAYASKAFCCKAIYKIIDKLGMSADVVSGGELYIALSAGFNPSKIFFHGNNKLYAELEYAVRSGVGVIVIDHPDEIDVIDALAKSCGRVQKVMLRVNPGVEAHTHAYIQTATTDSKFGSSLRDGTADSIIKNIVNKNNLYFFGLHSHIGSQIFEMEAFAKAVDILTDYIVKLNGIGIEVEAVNLGGGFGINYTNEDPDLKPEDYVGYVRNLTTALKNAAKNKNIKLPYMVIEPGRSLVGEAGITLYTVGAIKDINNIRKYIAIDGGMFDNPRYVLYGSKYSAVLANKAGDPQTDKVSIAGKCCESGDKIGDDMLLQTAKRGDILAVFATGAYNYSMASNYNANFVPPVVLVENGRADYIVKPQTNEDLVRNNVVPDWL